MKYNTKMLCIRNYVRRHTWKPMIRNSVRNIPRQATFRKIPRNSLVNSCTRIIAAYYGSQAIEFYEVA